MPFIPQNEYNPSAPIVGCTNAEVDRHERMLALMADQPLCPQLWPLIKVAPSPASLMLADLAITYSEDDATVAVIERMMDPIGSVMRAIASLEAEVDAKYCKEVERLMDVYQTRKEQDDDQRARDWLASLPAAKGE